VNAEERRALIERYRSAPADLEAAVSGLSPEQLDSSPDSGPWSVRQIVNHVADAELASAARMRRLLTEDRPRIPAFDQDEYARRLRAHQRSVRAALSLVWAIREVNADLLATLDDGDWQRRAVHEETGQYTLEEWLAEKRDADHIREHVAQIRQARS
jgi:uncharacterized damage-inducible protein DinB